jgi:hypothetical protein
MNLTSIGAKAFRDGMREQKQAYSIFAFNLPIDDLIPEWQHRFQIEDWQQNIDRTGKLSDLVGVPVIKFKDSPWAVVYWSIGRYLELSGDCWSIARKLDCRSICIYESDRSGYVEWKVYRGEDEIECAIRESDDDSIYFESSLHDDPEKLENIEDSNILKSNLDRYLDRLLTTERVWIPPLILDLNDPQIERVDLFILPSRPLGMKDFQNWIYEGHPEYAIFAVKADIDRVAPVLGNSPQTIWQKDVQSATRILDIVSDCGRNDLTIIQPTESEWSIVYWADLLKLSDLCSDISAKLGTKVMSLCESDTAGAIGYQIFDRGKSIERVEAYPGEELFFESEIGEEPEFNEFDEDSEMDVYNKFINDRFIEEGIYIPAWTLNVSDPWIARVDLIAR